jgi:hypothetical protein
MFVDGNIIIKILINFEDYVTFLIKGLVLRAGHFNKTKCRFL